MKILRISAVVLFLLSLAAFAGFRKYEADTTDYLGPELKCREASITVKANTPEEELLKGITAYDKKDGDVTNSVIIERMSVFTGKGKRKVTYAAFDKSGNAGRLTREIIYSDYSPPRFALSAPLILGVGDADHILEFVTARDCIDGDITNKIQYDLADQYLGSYEGMSDIELRVTNSAGDTAYLPVTVEFRDTKRNLNYIPQIQLSNYLVYIKSGSYFDAKSYLAGYRIGQNQYTFPNAASKGMVSVSSNVNQNDPGVYEVNYSLTADNGYTGTVKLIVAVEE